MKQRLVIGTAAGGLGVVLLLLAALMWFHRDGAEPIERFETVARPPKIHPDYTDTVIPPNICPMNFVVDEPGEKYCVRISGPRGGAVEVFSRSGGVVIPMKPWRALLEGNRGEALSIEVYVKDGEGTWRRFAPVTNTVAREPIDRWLVYREMPVYNLVWSDMGIYQRNLEGYDEGVILHNRAFGHGCCNCHSFLKSDPSWFAMSVRKAPLGPPLGGLLIARDGAVKKIVDTTMPMTQMAATYLAWHPSGKAIAFSANKVNQTFHIYGEDRRATDSVSDMGVYLVEPNVVTTSPDIARPDRLETSPAWSCDGRWLYFCSAPRLPIEQYRELRYDLMRIPYDIDANTWGAVETVLSAKDTGLSIAQPKVSPDGRWMLLCMAESGGFPAFDRTSDLYLVELETRRYHKLDINSDQAESWHSWSSNSRWIVFSSKRPEGLLARPYLSYVDPEGTARKSFLVPRKDPAYYDSSFRMCNRPELARERVALTQRKIARAIRSGELQQKAGLDPRLRRTDAATQATQVVPKDSRTPADR